MNKKTIFTFLLGAVAAGAIFGAASLMAKNSATCQMTVPAAPLAVVTAPAVSQPLVKPLEKEPTLATSAASETLAFKALFSLEPDAHSVIYVVKPGDNLTAIARKHNVAVDMIKRVNVLSSDRLIPGRKLKIPTYKFSLVVDKSLNTLILKGDEEVLKTYVVSTGEHNSSPVGVFKITDKLVNPTWYKAGAVVPSGSPQNVLGTRWLGISAKGYGIHGTTEPEKLGQQVTAGCVRMKNEEVEELYGFVPPGTEVTIVD